MSVYIVVNLDSGWDNVVGVFDTYEKALKASRPTEEDLTDDPEFYLSMLRDRDDPNSIYDMYHIHEKEIQ